MDGSLIRKEKVADSTISGYVWTGPKSFHVVVLQRTAKNCTQIYNARAQPLFCSLCLLLGDVLVAVAVMVCVRFLMVYSTNRGLLVSNFHGFRRFFIDPRK